MGKITSVIIFGGFGLVPQHHTGVAAGMARGHVSPSSVSGQDKRW